MYLLVLMEFHRSDSYNIPDFDVTDSVRRLLLVSSSCSGAVLVEAVSAR